MMGQSSEASLPLTAETLAADQRDVQRAALQELVRLCSEAATTEIEIEKKHQTQISSAKLQLEKTFAQIQQRHQQLVEKITTEHEQRVAELAQKHQKALEDLKAHTVRARQQVELENDSVEQDLNSRLQQAIWLAESVFEATQNQIAREYKQARELHASRMEELEEMGKQASALLALYGQTSLLNVPEPQPQKQTTARGTYSEHLQTIKELLSQLENLWAPRMFVGIRPAAAVAGICAASMFLTQWIAGGLPFDFGAFELKVREVGLALLASALACAVTGVLLKMLARSQVRSTYLPLRQALAAAVDAADAALNESRSQRDQKTTQATRKRDLEIQAARDKYGPLQAQAAQNRQTAINVVETNYARRLTRLNAQYEQALAQVRQSQDQNLAEAERSRQREIADAQAQHDQAVASSNQQYEQARAELEHRWHEGLAQIQTPIERNLQTSDDAQILLDWRDVRWSNWTPPRSFPSRVRFGQLHVDLKQITDRYPRQLELPPTFSVPASLTFPQHASMLIHADHSARSEAIRIQQMLMARLLTQLPPGRVRFTIIDPVGLGQNFAGFMHLADHDEALVGSRIWTEAEHIEQQLANLTEHMETVIQKYLRNEFATIDDYNAQAGELAEPYRYLIIADFPVGFEGDAFRRLSSIATSGARCGVFFIIVRDTRQPLPAGAHLDELEAHSINLVRRDDRFIWRDEIFRQFPLTLDSPPDEKFLTDILEVVGRHAKLAKRVEVPFAAIAPSSEQIWSGDTTEELAVPIGRLGATRLQTLRLGRGVAQHALIAGKTGSGKSTLLHVLVTNLALWYSPDQVEFYLVDFKKGVEFKTYATHGLPHARAIAVESDREFGLSVLQRIDAELTRRGELFRKLGVQDLPAYRQVAAEKDKTMEGSRLSPLPRTLLIIDEFQEFFSEDDKLAQEAALLLDRLVRQGRAFGIHVLLGSQTIGGTSGLARSTIGQMAVRIALQTSEADSQLILGDNNSAARLLSRPGEAIYNDAGGLVEGNSPFQVSWLPEEEREVYLERVREKSRQLHSQYPEPIVFEGNAPADITRNKQLARMLESPQASPGSAPVIWLGEPVAIKPPTTVTLRQQSGANVLIVGQYDEAAMALVAAAMISLGAQLPPDRARFFLFDGTPADSPLSGTLPRVAAALPHDTTQVEWRAVSQAVAQIAQEVQDRQSAQHHDFPSLFVLIYGLQRYRMLRKSEESFGFSMDDAEKKPQPDRLFADILREGAAVGVHVIAWVDTAASIERTLDRSSMREFDHRVLFQMSAADSSNLIDSPLANKLGFHRAIAYSEELGVMEKFRPYALPKKEWLEQVHALLRRKRQG